MTNPIIYVEGSDFTLSGSTREYSRNLAYTGYYTDKYGRDTSRLDKALTVRSYYNVVENDLHTRSAMTIEDLLRRVALRRAAVLAGEMDPLGQLVEQRNRLLEGIGILLSATAQAVSKLEANKKDKDTETCEGLCYYLWRYISTDKIEEAGDEFYQWVVANKDSATNPCSSSRLDGYISRANQLLKTELDILNNVAQQDIMRLDNLLTKREDSYELATNLPSTMSHQRDEVLGNMG